MVVVRNPVALHGSKKITILHDTLRILLYYSWYLFGEKKGNVKEIFCVLSVKEIFWVY